MKTIEVNIDKVKIIEYLNPYTGPYIVPAPIGTDTVLLTDDHTMSDNLTITAIQDKGDPSGTISTVLQEISIPSGYYGTAGTVKISASEQSKVVASSIIYGKDILGVNGSADHILEVTSTPLIKQTSIVHNTTDGKYYIWRD